MKPTDVYGAKRLAALYLIPTIFLLLLGGALLAVRLLLGYRLVSYLVAISWLGSLYGLYLSLYEAFFRYRSLCQIEGKDVVASLTHLKSLTGGISRHVLARYEENGEVIEGRLYGTFLKRFARDYHDGDQVLVRLLKTREFLLYEKQGAKSLQKSRR